MKKCHYLSDHDGSRVLIPGCMSVANSNDKRDCCCPARRITRPNIRREIRDLKSRIETLELMLKTQTQEPTNGK